MTFLGANISVNFDGTQMITMEDDGFDQMAPYAAGGICADLYTDEVPYTLTVDDVQTTKWVAPPTIEAQPIGSSKETGSAATFKVRAAGKMLAYQWQFKGANIRGATGSSYSRANLRLSDSGDYSVMVTNLAGEVASVPANLSVFVPVPPAILKQPQPRTVLAGQDVDLAVAANGTAPLKYQWHFNGAPITGATGATYVVKNVESANIGNYSVSVTNKYGSLASTPAVLNVNYTLSVPPTPGGLVAVWPVQASYAPGAKVTLVPSPASGFRFTQWSGDVFSTTNQLVITIRSNTTINATFTRNTLSRWLGGL
jgi:hypothetical protein